MTRALGICLVLLLVAAPVRGQERATCASWIADKPSPGQPPSAARTARLSWLFDTIAVHSKEPERDYYAGQIDLTEGVDAGEIAAWMDGYCTAHRSDDLEQAATALMRELSLNWLKRGAH